MSDNRAFLNVGSVSKLEKEFSLVMLEHVLKHHLYAKIVYHNKRSAGAVTILDPFEEVSINSYKMSLAADIAGARWVSWSHVPGV